VYDKIVGFVPNPRDAGSVGWALAHADGLGIATARAAWAKAHPTMARGNSISTMWDEAGLFESGFEVRSGEAYTATRERGSTVQVKPNLQRM